MAGAILVLLGLARFGGVLRYIPDPVIAGFTAGIGVVIFVGQWKDFLGLDVAVSGRFDEKLRTLVLAFPHLQGPTVLVGCLALAATLFGPRLPLLRRVPGPLIGMLAGTGLQALASFDGVATIASAFGGIPRGLPHVVLPDLTMARLVGLVPAAFTIAMLGAIESLLSAVVADGMAGTRHDPNQELIGQGIANLVVPLFGGFAATGAIARTATSVRNGANGPLAGVVHALTILVTLLVLAPLAGHIPLCALSAILFVVAWNMSDARHCVHIVRTAPKADVVILLVTFGLTVLVDLVTAVNVGVILAMLLFLRRMSAAVEVRVDPSASLAGGTPIPRDVVVFTIEGPLFFGAVENLERALQQTSTDPKAVVIRLGRVPFMDLTGLQSLQEGIEGLERRGLRVTLCEARSNVLRKLLRAGVIGRRAASKRYHHDLDQALDALVSTASQSATNAR
jgi:SulP family sulfate permease